MIQHKVITNFKNFKDATLALLAATIVERLTGNPGFVFTGKELTDVAEKTASFQDWLEKAASKEIVAVAEKNKARALLLEALNILATVVNLLAKNNEVLLKSTGIPLVDKDRSVNPEKPDTIIVENTGIPGQLRVKLRGSKRFRRGMVIAISKVKDAPKDINKREIIYSTKLTYVIEGLVSGEEYEVCGSFAYANDNDLVYSDIVRIFCA